MRSTPEILQSYFQPGYSGVLVEVGAAHPFFESHSFLFRPPEVQKKIWHQYFEHAWPPQTLNSSWEVICVEPNPDFCKEFRKIGFPILEYACTSTDIGRTKFQISPDPMCTSALEVRITGYKKSEYKTVKVLALTLNTILKTNHPHLTSIDILIIDTEGWGMEVLQGLDFKKYNPTLVLVEIIGSQESPDFYTNYMAEKGYEYEMDLSPNMLFIKKELKNSQ